LEEEYFSSTLVFFATFPDSKKAKGATSGGTSPTFFNKEIYCNWRKAMGGPKGAVTIPLVKDDVYYLI